MSVEINKILLQEEIARKLPNYDQTRYFKTMVDILDSTDQKTVQFLNKELKTMGFDAIKFLRSIKKISSSEYIEKNELDQLGNGAK